MSHLSRPFAKQNVYYLLRGTHTTSKKGLTATPPAYPHPSPLYTSHLCEASLRKFLGNSIWFSISLKLFDFAFLMNFSYCEFLALNFATGCRARGVADGGTVEREVRGERCRLLPVLLTPRRVFLENSSGRQTFGLVNFCQGCHVVAKGCQDFGQFCMFCHQIYS